MPDREDAGRLINCWSASMISTGGRWWWCSPGMSYNWFWLLD